MDSLSPEVFETRRRQMMDQIGDEGVAVFVGPPPRNRSNDTDYPYRPSSDVVYLSGFREPRAVLVLAPGHDEGQFVMFVPKRDEKYERWEGRRAGPEGAVEKFGADAAFALEDLDEELPKWFEGRKRLYYTLGSDPDFDQKMLRWTQTKRHSRGKVAKMPGAVVDVRDLLFKARLTKSKEELELMRRACEISSEAHILAMKHCRPGIYEYELQGLIEYHFRRSGGEFPAYSSIVGAGDNATILHYTDNNSKIGDQDVVLIDAGVEYQFYAGDITRSFPASGKFTPAQRDIYQAVLEVEKATIELVSTDATYEELQESSRRMITEALVELGLLEGSVDELMEEKAYGDYYPHSIGHPLGVDVHDVGLFKVSDDEAHDLVANMVLTIEPGIYVPAADENAPEEMRGIGVRIEDDILVTESGYENLTASCPKEVDEIEALVGSGDPKALEL